MKTLNYSGQREAIKTFLRFRHDHPTAEMIYAGVREIYPKISISTVYRNLALLSETGELFRFSVGDGKEHYDYHTEPHLHFICKKCGSITDVELPDREQQNSFSVSSYVAKQLNASVETEWTYVYGTCAECTSSENAAAE